MHSIMKKDSPFARLTWTMQKPCLLFTYEDSVAGTPLTVLMKMGRVEGKAHALKWLFFDNSRGKKAPILPARQNKEMLFKVYQRAVLWNNCLSFLYNYVLTETALQTRYEIWSMGTSHPLVCVHGNEGGFWKVGNTHQQHKMLSKKMNKRPWCSKWPKEQNSQWWVLVHFIRSIFAANFHGAEWRAVLYKQQKITTKTMQHHGLSSYCTSQESLKSDFSRAETTLTHKCI